MPAQSGVRREVVAVLGQPDPLQPDDQDELEAAATHRGEQRSEVAGREGADAEELEVEHRLVDAQLDHAEQRRAAASPPSSIASTNGDVQPIVCPP